MDKQKFNKPVLNLDEKIELLKQRWLIIKNVDMAKDKLKHIGYFRLSWYFKFFQDLETDIFNEWTTFDDVIYLYNFDSELRIFTMDMIEKIEISLKANINDYMTEKYGIFWYLDTDLFNKDIKNWADIYDKLINRINEIVEKKKSPFVEKYFEKYDEKNLPSWMLFEELTIWNVSNIFNIINEEDSINIASVYDTYYWDLKRWLRLIVQVRNICAHHWRLWNNDLHIRLRKKDVILKDKFVLEKTSKWEVAKNYYNFFLVASYLLKIIDNKFNVVDRLDYLFWKYPNVDKHKMWFTENRKEKFT